MEPRQPRQRVVWRCSPKTLRWAGLGVKTLPAIAIALIVAGLAGGVALDFGLVTGLMLLAIALGLYRFSLYPTVEATRNALVVRNPLTTSAIPWEDITKLSPRYSGISVERKRGYPVTIWCAQKANWDAAHGRRSHADEVIEGIAAYRSGTDPRQGEAIVQTEHEEASTKKSARKTIAIGSVGLLVYIFLQIIREG